MQKNEDCLNRQSEYCIFIDMRRSVSYEHARATLLDYMPAHAVPGTVPSHFKESYTGTYGNEGYGGIRIYLEDGKLFMDMRDVRHLLLTHFHYDVFRVDGIKEDTNTIAAPISFITDTDTGRINGFSLRLEPLVDDIVYVRR